MRLLASSPERSAANSGEPDVAVKRFDVRYRIPIRG